MRKLQINTHLFNTLFPEKERHEMERRVAWALVWGDPASAPTLNLEYFARLGSYAGRAKDLPDDIEPCNDLFPPNVAVLDYLLKFVDPREGLILDFACGLGGLVVRLRESGFRAYGFDRWTQLSLSAALLFFKLYGFYGDQVLIKTLGENHIAIHDSDAVIHPPMTLTFVGGHWDWITPDDAKAIFTPALKRVLVDANYSPKAIAGFDLVAQYEGLLHVFERTE